MSETIDLDVRRDVRREFLLALTDVLRGSGETNEILYAVSALVGRHFGVDRVGYGHVDENVDQIDYDVCWTDGTSPPILGRYPASAFGWRVINKLRAGETVVIGDVRNHELTDDQPAVDTSHEVDTRAILVTPLFKAGRLRTIVYLNQRPTRVWTEDDIDLMREVADRTRELIERARAEEALRASEARWRGLFERMQEGFFVGEAIRDAAGAMVDFRFIEVNPAFETLTGVPVQAALNRPLREVIPGVQDELIAAYARVVDTGQPVQFETQVSALNGRWYEARALKVAPEQFSVLFVEITQRKASEQALHQLNANLEARVAEALAERRLWAEIFETSDAMIGVLNREKIFLALNPAYAAHFQSRYGVTPKVGDRLLDLLADQPQHLADLRKIWRRALDAGEAFVVTEGLDQTPDGMSCELRFNPLRDHDGALAGAFQYAIDVTERLRAEARLGETEHALRQAQKMEAIGQLTGGVAHDFNNLLQVIGGNLQLLSKHVAAIPRAETRVENALAAVTRGAKLAAQLLAFSRRQPLQPKVVNVGRLAVSMDDMLRRALGEAVEIETVVAGGLWNTSIDPGQLENALLNLAINGRDAMDGTGRLTIEAGNASLDDDYARLHQDVAAGQYVLVAVTDTGAGMTPDVLAKVFDPFFSTKPEGRGTGLGLSMVYGFVKQSGGHVKIYSEPGEGTTVKLYLPRAFEPEDEISDINDGPVQGGAETVLVAEDDDEVRETAVAMLRELGYRVLTARDGASALDVVEGGARIDLLFTDVVMPGPLRSPDLARKTRERLPGVAVLFTSGYTENAIVHGGRLDLGVELLGKPYSREALARKVRQVLDDAAARRPSASG